VKVLDNSRRDKAALTFAVLAIASLASISAVALLSPRPGLLTLTAIAGIVGYSYFAGRAMRIWQGRGQPSLHRRAWRRHFLNEHRKLPLLGPKDLPTDRARAIRQAR
jgi:hypothetical protein